ncbi:hypothetical protein [Helicobacter sp. 23-1045]
MARKNFGKVLVAILLCGALFSQANAKEWHTTKEQKTGGFVGAELGFAPGWSVGAVGGYQWYFLDKPYFHLGLRLVGHLDYSGYVSVHSVGIGVAPHFVWDFLNIDSHTLGWHIAPAGLNLNFLIGNTLSFSPGYEFNLGLHYFYNIHHQVDFSFRYGLLGGWVSLGYTYKF